MDIEAPRFSKHLLFLEPAGHRELRLAGLFVLLSCAIFLMALPFARTALTPIPVFVPMYVSALVICDLITAVLLFGQFRVMRTPALLVLASGYWFTASATTAYALIFPGLFAPTGLWGSGAQTSSALYMFWHSGFPLAVMGYTLCQQRQDGTPDAGPAATDGWGLVARPRLAIAAVVGGVLVVVGGFTVFATAGQAYIPTFLEGNRTTDVGRLFLIGVWLLSLSALVRVWKSKPHTVLDVWILVVMCVWLLDIALAALLNTGRYDLGWYAGRLYGLLAASGLLMALLMEDVRHTGRLFQLSVELSAANRVLSNLARYDGLTGLANRRFFDEYLADQIAVANRYQRPLMLVICDVDHFKPFNDHYGHPAGDECLQRIANALSACCSRPADMAARYGGEEFALILPDTGLAGAVQMAEKVRAAVAQLGIEHRYSSAGPHVSISCGVASFVVGMGAEQLIAVADECLYRAKHGGRNQVFSAGVDGIGTA